MRLARILIMVPEPVKKRLICCGLRVTPPAAISGMYWSGNSVRVPNS
jgi:hypothetical protein